MNGRNILLNPRSGHPLGVLINAGDCASRLLERNAQIIILYGDVEPVAVPKLHPLAGLQHRSELFVRESSVAVFDKGRPGVRSVAGLPQPVQRRRLDVNDVRLEFGGAELLQSLIMRTQHRLQTGLEQFADAVDRSAVQIALEFAVFDEFTRVDVALHLFAVLEEVILAVHFALPRRPGSI